MKQVKLWINVATLTFSLVMNALAVFLPLNGNETGDISDRLNVLFTPAGYVFSIWSLIYVTLIIWTLLQFKSDRQTLAVYEQTYYPFWAINILNGLWILVWHYLFFGLSVIVMLLLLGSLIVMYKQVKKHKTSWLELAPFSIYLGWISVATITNISYYLTEIGWDGFGVSDQIWAIALLLVALLLATWFRYTQRDLIYPSVFVWALIGVGIENQERAEAVAATSFIVVGVLLVMMFVARKKEKRVSA